MLAVRQKSAIEGPVVVIGWVCHGCPGVNGRKSLKSIFGRHSRFRIGRSVPAVGIIIVVVDCTCNVEGKRRRSRLNQWNASEKEEYKSMITVSIKFTVWISSDVPFFLGQFACKLVFDKYFILLLLLILVICRLMDWTRQRVGMGLLSTQSPGLCQRRE